MGDEMPEGVPPILPEVLDLPSGGKVWFRDPETLRGGDYKRLRAARRDFEANMNRVYEIAAALLVQRWEVPDLPNLPLPGDPEGHDGKVTDLLHWRDCHALTQAMAPAIVLITEGQVRPPAPPSNG